jgi:Protein of unknown function (DUF4232)
MKTIRATRATAVGTAAVAATIGFAAPASADPGPCDAQALSVGVGFGPSAAADHRAAWLLFELRSGAGACQLSGYPTVEAVVNADGAAPIRAKQTPGGYMGGGSPDVIVTLQPGRGAEALLEWAVAPGGQDPACRIYGSAPNEVTLRTTPPGASHSFDLPYQFGQNEGLCNLQVHPLSRMP